MGNLNKNLEELINGLSYKIICGDIYGVTINKLCFDTRNVEKGDLFVCIEGARFDSHSKVSVISDMGAKVIVVDINNRYVEGADINEGTVVIGVNDTRIAEAIISKNYFCDAASSLKLIGITGTKGKTTSAFMIKRMLENDGFNVGMIGTIGVFYGDKHIETDNTTPGSYDLHKYFSEMRDSGCQFVVMEVSSQSLKYNRVYGLRFSYVLWTNIFPEHIGENEHSDFNDYLNSKLKIFSMTTSAVVNGGTDYFDDVVMACKKNGVGLIVKTDNIDITLSIPGKHNIENASLAFRFGIAFGISERIILKSLKETIVPGRSEIVYKDSEMELIVDFSYEGNGARNFLSTMKEYIKGTSRRIVAVFGCGGNRSKDRRYEMGKVTGELADFIILTADNSRYEKTLDIIADIETTLKDRKKKDDNKNGYIIIEDRRKAIEYAIKKHKKGDLICVMGKGHETTNEVNGKKTYFSDRETILNIINE